MGCLSTLGPGDWIAAVTTAATIAGVVVVILQLRKLEADTAFGPEFQKFVDEGIVGVKAKP
jgi:hypothetical protein